MSLTSRSRLAVLIGVIALLTLTIVSTSCSASSPSSSSSSSPMLRHNKPSASAAMRAAIHKQKSSFESSSFVGSPAPSSCSFCNTSTCGMYSPGFCYLNTFGTYSCDTCGDCVARGGECKMIIWNSVYVNCTVPAPDIAPENTQPPPCEQSCSNAFNECIYNCQNSTSNDCDDTCTAEANQCDYECLPAECHNSDVEDQSDHHTNNHAASRGDEVSLSPGFDCNQCKDGYESCHCIPWTNICGCISKTLFKATTQVVESSHIVKNAKHVKKSNQAVVGVSSVPRHQSSTQQHQPHHHRSVSLSPNFNCSTCAPLGDECYCLPWVEPPLCGCSPLTVPNKSSSPFDDASDSSSSSSSSSASSSRRVSVLPPVVKSNEYPTCESCESAGGECHIYHGLYLNCLFNHQSSTSESAPSIIHKTQESLHTNLIMA